jgi:acetyl-CoA synthetase
LRRSHRRAQHNAVRNAHNLQNAFAAQLGKALAPKEVLFVGDIPKTRNAKVMRRIVRAAYLGEKLGDTSALENPASLKEINQLGQRA